VAAYFPPMVCLSVKRLFSVRLNERMFMSSLKSLPFSDLDSRGWILIPSFLDGGEIETLEKDFAAAPLEVNSNYSVRRISPAGLSGLEPRFEEVLGEVREHSSVRVDLLNDGVYFATFAEKATLANPRGGAQQFPWHQDHENYWLWHDTKNYLNFYIPVVKPVLEKSNLTVVPFDRFAARAPQLHAKLLGRGATRVVSSGKKWVIKDDDRGGKVGTLDFDLAEIEETPLLHPGDLLLMRGDLIHRTQDSSTRRIAASIRYINSQTPVPRWSLSRGGLAKSLMMLNARYLFEPAFECFEKAGAETLPAGQIDHYLRELRDLRLAGKAAANSSKLGFLARLAREKLRRSRGISPSTSATL